MALVNFQLKYLDPSPWVANRKIRRYQKYPRGLFEMPCVPRWGEGRKTVHTPKIKVGFLEHRKVAGA